ncbi:MAG: hypothetical protein BWY76_02579 [bacterium ADurb.Bin429]|nr:MAG: hypothetical protein BWY76_02579 [bacterium ADurb.Bin429]
MRGFLLLGTLVMALITHAQPAISGFDFAAWGPGIYSTPGSDTSLTNLAATGANWVGIVVTVYQPNMRATNIQPLPIATPTDADLRHAITTAHRLGLKVMLKPHVDLSRDDAHWRGEIGPAFSAAQWLRWFAAYMRVITRYAAFARNEKVELFCVGTELEGTSGREAEWRQIIATVRAAYDGPLVYAANWSGEATTIRFWDALDYLGVDAYYPLTTKAGATAAELKQGWATGVKELAGLHAHWKKPILLTEVGFRSSAGACREPWEWQTSPALDLREQANGYQATFEALWTQPWLAGLFWWDWEADLSHGGQKDGGYTPWGKPAETIVRRYYAPAP